ncbi:MAG: serine/threonine protein kinase [Sandaracinaceae bacterium]|nr:serine/threonine protein kinase [Sandaracinaceae bacterium]
MEKKEGAWQGGLLRGTKVRMMGAGPEALKLQRDEELPRRFGPYTLFDRIGKGGMATIYLARMETSLGPERLVVIKKIHPELSQDPVFSAQFIAEAKLSASLRHANIVQVIELGREEGEKGPLFMAMEYVEGLDLNELLRRLSRGKIPLKPEFAFHIVREMLVALDFAHRATDQSGQPLGIVHRDVSPSNVLISFEGEVKLCDFGIAKVHGRALEIGKGHFDGSKIVGKSAYMSPEQARGEELDARSDVFASGIILWELCAGRRLYRGSEGEMLEQAKRAQIPRLPERGLPGHSELQAILDQALAPEREARFPSAKAMLEALDDYLIRHHLLTSQIRFAAFLREHFGDEIVATRREREMASRAFKGEAAAEEARDEAGANELALEKPNEAEPVHELPTELFLPVFRGKGEEKSPRELSERSERKATVFVLSPLAIGVGAILLALVSALLGAWVFRLIHE